MFAQSNAHILTERADRQTDAIQVSSKIFDLHEISRKGTSGLLKISFRRKFRSETSDSMDGWIRTARKKLSLGESQT